MNQTIAQAIDAEEACLMAALRLNHQRLRAVREARRVLKDTELTQTWSGIEVRHNRALFDSDGFEIPADDDSAQRSSLCTVRVTLDMVRAGAEELQSAERTSRSRLGDAAVVFWSMINVFPGGPRRWADLWATAENDPKCVSITNWEGESNGRRS